MTTYTRTFYLHLFLLVSNVFFIVIILGYMTIPDTDFEELDTEICIEREPITNYCLETERLEGSDKMNDNVIYFVLVLNLTFLFFNLIRIKQEYTKENTSWRNN